MYILLSLLLLLLTSVLPFTQGSRWPRYVSKAERADIVSTSLQESDTLMMARTHTGIRIYWVTDALARADVSDDIDEQRLTNAQAEQKYRRLRAAANDVYIFR